MHAFEHALDNQNACHACGWVIAECSGHYADPNGHMCMFDLQLRFWPQIWTAFWATCQG